MTCPSCSRPIIRMSEGPLVWCGGITHSRAYHHADGSICVPPGRWCPADELHAADLTDEGRAAILRLAAQVADHLGENTSAELLHDIAENLAVSSGMGGADARP